MTAVLKGQLPPYSVSASLKEVVNRQRFSGTAEQKALLARNLFVVTPTGEEQLFYIYENNDYETVPSFITTDLILQLYHVFYDYSLRHTESEKLAPLLGQLTSRMLERSVDTWRKAADPQVREAALKNVAYFGVAARLLELKASLPAEARTLVERELRLIAKHEELAQGALFPYRVDYTQFVPRGHYTRTPVLTRFFKGTMWYGLAPFALRVQALPDGKSVPSPVTTRMGLLLVHDLFEAGLDDEWERIYEPTAFYVGLADDVTPGEFREAMKRVYDTRPILEALADNARLEQFQQEASRLRSAKVQGRVRHLAGGLLPLPDPASPQLRFMGQRHIPDSEILQRLSFPGGEGEPGRLFPSGMDVMAVLGSERARQHLDEGFPDLFDTRGWRNYPAERDALRAEFAALDEAAWTRNLYQGWLWSIQGVLTPVGEGVPSFMRSDAWMDKSLNTALASWAELRHDTILYAKQSFTAAECGGEGEEPPLPKGYVEPNVEFYRRVRKLARLSQEGLAQRKLLTEAMEQKFAEFDDLLDFLHRVSEKELKGERLTREEYDQIRIMGATVERMTLDVVESDAPTWREITSNTERDMAVIADVHTGGVAPNLQVLETGVGPASEILVIVPIEGKLYLTRGAVFSYYEFKRPYADRLTDEKWQSLLKSKQAPSLPEWTRSFMAPAPKGTRPSMKTQVYSSGC